MFKKRIPVNSLGKKLKTAREKLGISEEELALKINDKKINKKQIKKWEKGQEFPNLDEIYKLAYVIDVNPNEFLDIKNKIQEESKTEPNWALRNIMNRFLKIGKPGMKFIFELVLGVCIITLAKNWKIFEDKMGGVSDPEQEEFVVQVIQNNIDEYVYHDTTNTEKIDDAKNINSED